MYMEKKSLLQEAMEFAVMKHAGQMRKGGTIPYQAHVIEVMEAVCRLTEDEAVRAAAVLHDTLEDTATTREELLERFGQRVTDMVSAESENKRKDRPAEDTWLIRKKETVEHLAKAPTDIRTIALADKLSNVRAMVRDYRVIGDELWKRFHNADPVQQGKYYGLLAHAFEQDDSLRGTPACREFYSLCTELFGEGFDKDCDLFANA